MIEGILANADPATSRALGTYFQKLATALTASAASSEMVAAADARRRARAAERRHAAKMVITAVERGKSIEAALDQFAPYCDLEPAQLAELVRVYEGSAARRATLRNCKIMRHVARGWNDAELGRKFKLHPKSINRIVRRMLRAGVNPADRAPAPQAIRATPAPSNENLSRGNQMTDIDDALAPLLRAHAPALASAEHGSAVALLGPELDLRTDLGLDPIALAELAIAVEDTFEIDLDVDELAACARLGQFVRLIKAKTEAAGGALPLAHSTKSAG